MSISHFELQRSDEHLDGWYHLGLAADDLHQMARIMNTYDPEGTMQLRVWDHVRDEAVPVLQMLVVMGYENGRKAAAPVPIIVDWKHDGF
jgi:hypothetical protein